MGTISGKWYIWIFPAVMGFAAGTAIELGNGYVDAVIPAMGQVEGLDILSLALTGILFNCALISWCSIAEGAVGRIMCAIGIWTKAVLMGLFCRELAAGFSIIKALLMLFTVFGGGCMCMACLMKKNEAKLRARRMAVWLCGVAVECIIIPSVIRTWVLLFN